jgi:hypothetical protein
LREEVESAPCNHHRLSLSLFLVPLFHLLRKRNSLAVARVDVVALVLEHAPLGVRRARGERVVTVSKKRTR